jgi:hypothetical protein
MRKIINATYITLDGVIEGPHLWPSLGRPSDERAEQIQTDLALSCDALLMRRHTKYVVSATLKDPEWNIVQYGFGAVSRLLLVGAGPAGGLGDRIAQ